MTKAGFKSVTIPESLHSELTKKSRELNISISEYLRGVLGDSSPMPSKLITRVQIPIGALLYH